MTASTQTVWTWQDLGFFLGSILPSALLASFCAAWFTETAVRALIFQVAIYILLLSVLYGLAHMRHETQLQIAASWTTRFPGAPYYILTGPLLAIVMVALSELLRAPAVTNPVDLLTTGSIPLPVVSLFAVVIGPLFEELFFRGFLQPLLAAHWGQRIGLFLTSAGFSLLHGVQYEWHWQYLLVLSSSASPSAERAIAPAPPPRPSCSTWATTSRCSPARSSSGPSLTRAAASRQGLPSRPVAPATSIPPMQPKSKSTAPAPTSTRRSE